jgi:hypothetical protein
MNKDPRITELADEIEKMYLIKPKKGRELGSIEFYQNERTQQILSYIRGYKTETPAPN